MILGCGISTTGVQQWNIDAAMLYMIRIQTKLRNWEIRPYLVKKAKIEPSPNGSNRKIYSPNPLITQNYTSIYSAFLFIINDSFMIE